MTTKNKLLLTVVTITLVGGGLLITSPVSAQETTTKEGPMAALAQRIATRFGLNQADVQKVFDDAHSDMQALRKTERDAHLQQLVSEGKLTETQRQLILAKHAEMEANREAHQAEMVNKTPAERQAFREARRTELENWAKQNGIDPQYLMMGNGRGPGKGRGDGPMHQGR